MAESGHARIYNFSELTTIKMILIRQLQRLQLVKAMHGMIHVIR